MAAASTLVGATSLADYLCSLGEGDGCPCCGGVLKAGASARECDILRCPACGCELEAEEQAFRATSDQGFELAA